MQRKTLSRVILGLCAGGALAIPVRVSTAGPSNGIIHFNDACAQATECQLNQHNYLCSTFHADVKDAKCSGENRCYGSIQ